MLRERFLKLAGEPLKIDIMITERCNLRCRMCNSWKAEIHRKPPEVECSRWITLIDDLFKLAEIRLLCIGGGEPFLKDGLLDLVSHCTALNIYTVIVSNGTLIDSQKAKEIAKSGLKVLSLSVDALEKDHDFLRGKEGVFKNAMEAIGNLNKFAPDTSVSISTMICKQNFKEIPSLIKLVQLDKRIESINFQAIQKVTEYTDRFWYRSEPLWPDYDISLQAVLNYIIDKKKEGYKIANPLQQLYNFREFFKDPENAKIKLRCKAGFSAFPCDPYGDLHLCPRMKSPGNILNHTASELYFNEIATKVREKTLNCDEKCHFLINCYEENRENW